MEERTVQSTGLRLHRRSVLRMMAALPLASLVPLRALAVDLSNAATVPGVVTADATGTLKLQILQPHEWRSICVLSDWIIPADEVSAGAVDAGVPEFIDDWLNFQRGDLLAVIRNGLIWLDAEGRSHYGNYFVNCAPDQQKQILDRVAWPHQAAPQDAEAVAFFNQLRDLVLSGFYTSETGIRDLPYLGNEPQTAWHGCPTGALEKLGV
jgi:Gluconate 2-dehydrogenase subunit 3